MWRKLHLVTPDDGSLGPPPNYAACKACPACCILPLIDQLKKCASHLELLKGNSEKSELDNVTQRRIAAMAFGDRLREVGGLDESNRIEHLSNPAFSGKIMALLKLLEKWHNAYTEVNKVRVRSVGGRAGWQPAWQPQHTCTPLTIPGAHRC